jgi:hypothetical protein
MLWVFRELVQKSLARVVADMRLSAFTTVCHRNPHFLVASAGYPLSISIPAQVPACKVGTRPAANMQPVRCLPQVFVISERLSRLQLAAVWQPS